MKGINNIMKYFYESTNEILLKVALNTITLTPYMKGIKSRKSLIIIIVIQSYD